MNISDLRYLSKMELTYKIDGGFLLIVINSLC